MIPAMAEVYTILDLLSLRIAGDIYSPSLETLTYPAMHLQPDASAFVSLVWSPYVGNCEYFQMHNVKEELVLWK